MQVIIAILCAIFLFGFLGAAQVVPTLLFVATGIAGFAANRRGYEGLAAFLFGLAVLFLIFMAMGL